MIQYVKRKELDISKYDFCIENSIQSRIYAFSWYLDIVADHWDVLVLDDYKAVMPIPWKRKYGIKYVYTPLRVLELGVFSIEKKQTNEFLKKIFNEFLFINLRMNTENYFKNFKENLVEKQQQYLLINDDFDNVLNNYRKDRKKDLKKAEKAGLKEKWNDSVENLIYLFQNNVGKRFKKKPENYYKIMRKIVTCCIDRDRGEVLSIYDKNNKLVSAGFFVKNKGKISILFSATDFKNRNNGANTFLIHSAIYKYHKVNSQFNFGGSSIESIANYFNSFGAKTFTYSEISYNNLPKVLKIFKK